MKKQFLLFAAIILLALPKSYSQDLPMVGKGSTNQMMKVGKVYEGKLIMKPSLIYEFDKKIGIGTDSPMYKLHVAGSIQADDDLIGTNVIGSIKTQIIQPVTYPSNITVSATSGDNRFLLKSDGNYAIGDIAQNYNNQFSMFELVSNAGDTYTSAIINNDIMQGKGLLIKTIGIPSQDIPLEIYHQDVSKFSVTGDGDIKFTGSLYQNGTLFNPSAWEQQGNDINYNNGNVGIGLEGPASSPNSKLHLYEMGAIGPSLRLENYQGVPGSPNYCWDIENNLYEFAISYGAGSLGGSNPIMTKMMVINNNGNIGIGVTDPSSKLQLEGNPGDQNWLVDLYNNQQSEKVYGLRIKCDAPDYGHDDRLFEVTSFSGTSLLVDGDGNVGIGTTSVNHKLEVIGNIDATSFSGDGSNLLNVDDEDWSFYGYDIFTNSNVGIGIEPSNEKLHVNGNQILTGTIDVNGISYLNGIVLDNDADITNADQIIGFNDLRFSGDDDGVTDMVIDATGNVGIGTTPTSKLTVDGKIVAEEIEVIANVPNSDYVFEEDYNLMELHKLESFVKENKHLPEVPSAKEFKENGYNMNDMDDLLLRKVEELTLYIIELKKEISELKKD